MKKLKVISLLKALNVTTASADEVLAIANRYKHTGHIAESDLDKARILKDELRDSTTIDIPAAEWLEAFNKLINK